MINFFQISDQAGVIEATPDTGNWLVLEHASLEEQKEIIQKYDLPADIFAASDKAEEISRYEHFDNSELGKISILSLTNLSAQT